MIDSRPRFLQGAFTFNGTGYTHLAPLDAALSYTVPGDKRAQFVYFRAGNSWGDMVYFALVQDGKPMRLFPVAAHGATHVPLAVIEDLPPGTVIDVHFAAPVNSTGTAVIDIGLIEID